MVPANPVASGPPPESSLRDHPCTIQSIGARGEAVYSRILLRRFLEAYWLRPENALWMTLRSIALRKVELQAPFVDLACGDGVFMFLHRGGEFHSDFDVFTDVASFDRSQAAHVDMFDCSTERYQPVVLDHPPTLVDCGVDGKPTLLAKAKALRAYAQLVQHDMNLALPLEPGRFQTVYCNAAYWVREIDGFLSELRRVSRAHGRVVLHVKLDSMRRYTLSAHESILGKELLELVGRGRLECWPTLASRDEWELRFKRAGFAVQDAFPFVTRTHAHIWDIGLRPIAPLLVRMANSLECSTRSAIKKDWVELLMELLLPFCLTDLNVFSTPDEPAEVQYVLIHR